MGLFAFRRMKEREAAAQAAASASDKPTKKTSTVTPAVASIVTAIGRHSRTFAFRGRSCRFRSSLTFPHSLKSEQTHQELAPFRATKLSTMASLAVEPTFATVILNEPAAMLLA